MRRYTYSARAAGDPAPVAGTIEAPTRKEAVRLLQARDLQVLRLDDAEGPARPAPPTSPGAAEGSPHLNSRQQLPFLEALQELVQSGLPASEAVRLLALRLQEPRLRALAAALWHRLGEGHTLSSAMGAHPGVFDRQTVNLIAAGEATGNLGEVLERLIQHFTQQRELRQQFLGALAYPAFICLVGGGVVLFLLFFLMPRLQPLLESLGGQLPLSARLLVGGSHFLLTFGPFLLLAAVGAAVAWWRWRQTPAGRRAGDEALLRIPLVRDYVRRAAVLDFTHTLAVLLENGITTAEALRLTERAVDNLAVQATLHDATDRVIEGSSLSAALARTRLLPDLMLDRLAVGEQTGNLAPSLRQIAGSLQKELSRRLHATTRLVSGLVLFVTFGFVAFLAYAIVSALFQVSASIRL